MSTERQLSEKAAKVLTLIAEGRNYGQIVESHPDISNTDIFQSAAEALRLGRVGSNYHERLAAIKAEYPQAYEPWTADEEARLATAHALGEQLSELARRFERQPSAIRSRLARLGLLISAD